MAVATTSPPPMTTMSNRLRAIREEAGARDHRNLPDAVNAFWAGCDAGLPEGTYQADRQR